MPLDNSRWGAAIFPAINAIGVTDTAKITPAQQDAIWIAITGEHKKEVNDNADIELEAADVSTDVPGLGLLDSVAGAVTGQATGTNQSVTLNQKIK